MSRRPRLTLAGEAHHVIQRGNSRNTDRELFLGELEKGLLKYDCRLHAYVLIGGFGDRLSIA